MSLNFPQQNRYAAIEDRAPAASRAFAILRYLAANGPSTLSEIVDGTGFNKSTTHYLLQTLTRQDAVELDISIRRYRLGIGLIELGAAASEGLTEVGVAKRYLSRILELFNVTIVLYQRASPSEVVLVDKIERVSRVRITLQMGIRVPIQGGSFGRAFLAFDPPSLVDTLLVNGLQAFTPVSVTDVEQFRSELDDVRRLGWAFDREGFALGVSTVAAPIFGAHGSVRLVAAAVGFSSVMTDEVAEDCGSVLREICDEISTNRHCGWRSGRAGSSDRTAAGRQEYDRRRRRRGWGCGRSGLR
jgi:DNA-binding IclR family transcriptional regulator